MTKFLTARIYRTAGDAGGTAPQPENTERRMSEREWEEQYRNKNASKSHSDLIQKNLDLERDNRDLRASRLKDGMVAIAKEDAELLDQLRTLGTPNDLKTALGERDTLKTELSTRDHRDGVRSAAEVAGWKPSVLERILPANSTLEVREVDGVKTSFLKLSDGKEVLLTDWGKSEASDFLPSLSVQSSTTQTPAAQIPEPRAAWPTQPPPAAQTQQQSDNPLLDYAMKKNAASTPTKTGV